MGEQEEPVRFELSMRPSFRDRADPVKVIGAPIRFQLGDDVVMVGTVVSWADAANGSVILTVEGSAEG